MEICFLRYPGLCGVAIAGRGFWSQRELCREVVREAALVDSAKQPRPRLAVVRLLPVKQDIRCGKLRAPPPATFVLTSFENVRT